MTNIHMTEESARGTDLNRPSIPNLFLSFLGLGATAFGGPAMIVHIRKMAVQKKRWLDEPVFRNGVALCQAIPGATAMQVCSSSAFALAGSVEPQEVFWALFFRPSC